MGVSDLSTTVDSVATYVYGGEAGEGVAVPNASPVWRDELRAAAAARREAEAELERRTAELRALMAGAAADGVPIATIADYCGLTRKTVYAYIERAKREQ